MSQHGEHAQDPIVVDVTGQAQMPPPPPRPGGDGTAGGQPLPPALPQAADGTGAGDGQQQGQQQGQSHWQQQGWQAGAPGGGTRGLSETGIIWLCYALHLAAVFCGGVTAIIALIINYVKRADARRGLAGPLTASHMQWQITTFWLSLLFLAIAGLLSVVLALSVVGLLLVYPVWIGLFVWYVYRILRGMLCLNSGIDAPLGFVAPMAAPTPGGPGRER